ncbi:MAG: hypothetical protein IT198_02940 [Acidimicrobiia bacterium]|nr:hypothetical protein [Acidimicrobiia bacterium]
MRNAPTDPPSAAAFGVAETFTLASRTVHAAGAHAGIDVNAVMSRPLVDPVLHMMLSGIFGAVAWRTWHLQGRFCLTRRVVGTLLLVMALHDLVDGVLLFGKAAGVVVWVALTAAIYVAFRHIARTAVPPDNLDLVPPRWRPAAGPLGI